MLLADWRRESFIRSILKRLSRQRVAVILQPGNVWVVERSPREEPFVEEALRTCHLRGWVEPIADAVRKGQLTQDGTLPDGELFSSFGPLYRLTDSGWNAIRRTHSWVVFTFVVASLTLAATIIGTVIAL